MSREKNKLSPMVWAEVDLGRLRNNLRAIRRHLGDSKVGVLAIVKANAYGHGMKEVAGVLRADGVDFFGVANIDEAVELRSVCKREKILVLGCFHPAQIPLYRKHAITPTLSSLEDADIWLRGTAKPGPAHVKIDTGMGRLGVWHEDATDFFKELKKRKSLIVEGIYTHFANADHVDPWFTDEQIEAFNKAVAVARSFGFKPRYLHAANSMGLSRFRKAHLNLVRPGIILYGMNPVVGALLAGSRGRAQGPPLRGLKPILSLKTRISFLREVDKGRSISYGSMHVTPQKTRIATLPIGYSHGYRVGFSNKSSVIVRGVKCPVVGRVTMDYTLIDVGFAAAANRWDEVTLIGQNGKGQIPAEALAALIDTVPYEITCAIHSRVPRIYKK